MERDRNFVADRLPWLVALGALVTYLFTLNPWITPSNVAQVIKVSGWDWRPVFVESLQPLPAAPLLFLLTAPLRLLPDAWIPFGLNALAALCAAATLALLARCAPFDAAMVDLQLPDRDGLSLAAEMRHQPNGTILPIMLLSSVRVRSDDPRPGELGITVFIHKPVRPAQLLDALCRAMSVQVAKEKKAPLTPTLDINFARRFPLRVLLADDNPINQKVGLSVLQKLGYRADLAANGTEVIKAIEQKPYDILFCDVQMPEMDGLECARQICKRWSRDKRPIIIAMTGNALMGDREKCLSAGMDDYISKPVRIAELQGVLERWAPTKPHTTDTTYFLRHPQSISSGLLDEHIIAELREMPPNEGVSMLRELIDLFLDAAPTRITQIYQFSNEPQKLAFHAHALKSICLNLGCKRIIELAQKLEDLGRSGDVNNALDLIRDLESVYSQTKAQLLILRNQEAASAINPAS